MPTDEESTKAATEPEALQELLGRLRGTDTVAKNLWRSSLLWLTARCFIAATRWDFVAEVTLKKTRGGYDVGGVARLIKEARASLGET